MHLQDLFWSQLYRLLYFPGSSAGVESASNAGGLGSMPSLGTKIPRAVWCGQK